MLFTVCQNSIGKYDFGSVALYAPLPRGVLQVAKSPVLLGLSEINSLDTALHTSSSNQLFSEYA